MAWRENWGENDSAHHAARHATKNPFFFNLTPEIEIPDSYLVFLVLEQFLNCVVVVGVGGWKNSRRGYGPTRAMAWRFGPIVVRAVLPPPWPDQILNWHALGAQNSGDGICSGGVGRGVDRVGKGSMRAN